MAWFLGQSLVFLLLAFALGLVVGWLIWGRRAPATAAPALLAAAAPRPAADAEPVSFRARPAPVTDEPVFDGQAASEPEPEPVVGTSTGQRDLGADRGGKVAAAPEPQPVIASVAIHEQDGERRDDLQRIEGIGPKISSVLNQAGIQTYQRLAEIDRLTLTETLSAGGVKFAPSLATWSDQARLLADGDEAGFADFLSRLVAARRAR